MSSARGAGSPSRDQRSMFCSAASMKIAFGKRLRGPSLQLIGGTARPAARMSSGRAENRSSSGDACAAPAIS
jgi:hypothetical protein